MTTRAGKRRLATGLAVGARVAAACVCFTFASFGPASAQGLPPGVTASEVEARVVSNLSIDLATLLPPGTTVVNNFCAIDGIFGCLGRVDVSIQNPSPSLRGVSAQVVPLSSTSDVGTTLHDIEVAVRINGSGIAPSCDAYYTLLDVVVDAPFSIVSGAVGNPIDATQLANVDVTVGSDSFDFTSGICDFPLIGELINLISSAVSDLLELNLSDDLDTIDQNGNTPLAAAMEIPPVDIIDYVTVGAPGNACDPQTQGCFGRVDQRYRISKFEVTNAQYALFLEAVAAVDAHGLYNASMSSGLGGIELTSTAGNLHYGAIVGREAMPVNYVSFWDAVRFANWLHNGRPTGDQDGSTTEDGAYTLTPTDITNNTVARNIGATAFIPSEDEWYKAAYHNLAGSYFDYPVGSDTPTMCSIPGTVDNTANCDDALFDVSNVGTYTAATGPSGTFDQAGNVEEWNESIEGFDRGLRGGFFSDPPGGLAASFRDSDLATSESGQGGFRVASPAAPLPVPIMSPFAIGLILSLLGAVGVWRLRI